MHHRLSYLPGRAAAACLIAVLTWPAPQAAAEVLWRGDFETGDASQWRGPAVTSDAVRIVSDPVRAGKYAVRIDGTSAARRKDRDRIEFQHQPATTADGTERYFGWSVLVTKPLTDGVHHHLGYFEVRNAWRQVMTFEVVGPDVRFSTRVPYAQHWQGPGRFTPGVWHDFVVHVFWSRDPQRGFVEVWFDGELVVPRTMTATLLDENPAFFQIGLMRATSDVPETIYLDHAIEATTLEEATPPPRPQ